MKTPLLTVIIVSAFIWGCGKHVATSPGSSLTGDWKYIGYGGGLAGLKFTRVPDTINNYLQFDANRLLFKNNNVQTLTWYVFTNSSTAGFSGLLTFTDTAIYPGKYDISISNDTLILYPHGFDDAFTSYYARSSRKFNW